MIIREAETKDVDNMLDLAEMFCNSSQFLKKFNRKVFGGVCTRVIDSESGKIWVMEEDNKILGGLGAVIYEDFVSGNLIATEIFWFVHPDHRGYGIKLLHIYEAWAKYKGCKEVIMVHIMDSMPEKLQVVYRRLGYKAMEIHYIKEL